MGVADDVSESCMKHTGDGEDGPGPLPQSDGITIIELSTQYVLCCETPMMVEEHEISIEEEKEEAEEYKEQVFQQIYEGALLKYGLVSYNRQNGLWKGQTYEEGVNYCASRLPGEDGVPYEVCSYDAICPLGHNMQPLGGYKHSTDPSGDVWTPISDSENDWVQVSQHSADAIGKSCVRYSSVVDHLGTPRMDNEELTSEIYCCKVQPDEEEETNEDVVTTIDEVVAIQPIEQEYQSTALKYKPLWFSRDSGWIGKTYLQALAFCASAKNMIICPYDAICPAGEYTRPFGGYKSDDDSVEYWSPIENTLNGWVQVGDRTNACVTYRNKYGDTPDWGITGDNEDISTYGYNKVPYVMCCELNAVWVEEHEISIEEEKDEAEEYKEQVFQQIYEDALLKYGLVSYNRQNGLWKGQTYEEGVNYCASRLPGEDGVPYEVCSYDAICPLGHNMQPLGGYKHSTDPSGDVWTPISDSENDWVQVSQHSADAIGKSCVRYSSVVDHLGTPRMDNEELTSEIYCCKVQPDEEEETNEDVVTTIDEVVAIQPIEQEYQSTALKYKPLWFSRDSGWIGKTYLQALAFCASAKNMIICPYDAICPAGEYTRPFGGYKSDDDSVEYWSPIENTLNGWVQVGDRTNACVTYRNKYGDTPDWGITGDNEDISTYGYNKVPYVMCCELNAAWVEEHEISIEEEKEEAEEFHEESNEDVVTTIDEVVVDELPAVYNYTQDYWHPIAHDRTGGYTGQTYENAFSYCESQSSMLCPYEAYCPLGPYKVPYHGIVTDGSMWAPISNAYNMWIDLGASNTCKFYNNVNGEDPGWGEGTNEPDLGLNGEEIQGHIMCCDADVVLETHGNVMEAKVVTDKEIDKMLVEFGPRWFHRGVDGWEGSTWPDAIEFCAKDKGLSVCPYKAICPYGANKLPFDGDTFNGESESWAPVSNGFNLWVSVGKYDTCLQWEVVKDSSPEWGKSEGREDLTGHIVCCNDLDGGSYEELGDESNTQDAQDHAIIGNEGIASIEYKPRWYGRDNGWKGASWPEAIDFCSNQGVDQDDSKTGMEVCPFEAVCPNGIFEEPLGGAVSQTTETWAPISNSVNDWVKINEKEQCVKWSSKYKDPPAWGLEGGADELTSYVLCCVPIAAATSTTATTTTTTSTTTTTTTMSKPTSEPTSFPTSKPTLQPTTSEPTITPNLLTQTFQLVQEKFSAKWFDRSSGWEGSTYYEALTFCARRESSVPCPYEAYCPLGPGKHIIGGVKSTIASYAPIIDTPNGWISIGPGETCMPYNSFNPYPPEWGQTGNGSEEITPRIMCCREPEDGFGIQLIDESYDDVDVDNISTERSESEQGVMDQHHPVWYDRRNGYHGRTIEEAETFCNNIGGKRLCPRAAYCPNGPPMEDSKALYLDRPPFEGEQWAPVSGANNGDLPEWILIGTLFGIPTTTCGSYSELKGRPTAPPAQWDGNDGPSEHKQHILCCKEEELDEQGNNLEETMRDQHRPVWFDFIDGWEGGSWKDAEEFCYGHGGRQLCSYLAYCPYGNGKSAMRGHRYDFDTQGEQWAPIDDEEVGWVMIGQKYQNSATTCLSFVSLEGSAAPSNWEGMTDLKRHLMCCNPTYE